MAEYIEREGIKKSISFFFDIRLKITHSPIEIKQAVLEVIDGERAADVQPVKHGYWEEVTDYGGWGDTHYRCSVCGEEWYLEDGTPQQNNMNFCPRCGADMRDVPDTDVGEIANVVEFKKRLTDRQTAEALKSNAEGLLSKGIQVDIADLRYIKLVEYENKEENDVETTGS